MTDRGDPSGRDRLSGRDRPSGRADLPDRGDLSDESDRPDRSGGRSDLDPAVATATREELRTTFDYQVERLREIDTKAIEILKANLLLIGIVVTGGSIIVQTELDIAGFLNPFTVVGGLLLLASTGLAAVTYTASDLRGGMDIAAVDAVIADAPVDETDRSDTPEFNERLLRSYAEWIDYNARVTAVNDLLATVTVLLIFVAFVYVIAGVVVGGAGLSGLALWASFALLTLFVVAFTWLSANMDHLGTETSHPAASFEGVQISKGAARGEAWSSLRAMLGRRPRDELSTAESGETRD